MKRLFFAANLVLAVVTSFAVQASSIWFATENTVQQLDSDTRQIVTTLPLSEVKALAVDAADGGLLALTEKKILKFSSGGVKLWEKTLADIGLSEGKQLVANPYDGSLWLASEKKLVHLDSQGRQLNAWSAPGSVKRIAIALDESLWLLGESQVWHYSHNGALLASRSFSGLFDGEAKRLAVDSLGDHLWIASEKQLAQFDVTDLNKPPLIVSLSDEAKNIVIEPLSGALWVLGEKKLLAYANNAALLKNIDLASLGIGESESITYDPLSRSLWLGYEKGIAKVSQDGALLAKVALTGEVRAIGVPSFYVTPTLSLIHPPENALTNNAKPTITLGFDAQCFGAPCGFAPPYYASYSLTANLNNQSIGSLFSFDAITARSSYMPSSALPEGPSTFNAQARDSFGHVSNRLDTTFTIDTIPPKFLTISPAEGSVFTAPQAVISGTVDDAQAFIVLDGRAGPVNGPNFGFPVTLVPGSNTLKLTAIDKAGNQSSVDLHLTYAAVSVTVTSPVSGATISGDTVLVTGGFQGPANTGITVNGVVASISGNQFYANVTLQPGANTITVTATTVDGGAANQVVTVTSTGSLPFSVSTDIQEGIAPLKVKFRVSVTGAILVQSIAADFDGNGTIDFSATDIHTPMEFVYTNAGFYLARITVIDTAGNIFKFDLPVQVNRFTDMDAMLRGIYQGMLDKLKLGNVDGALNAVTAGVYKKYRDVFVALKPSLPAVIPTLGTLSAGTIGDEIAEYVLIRDNGGNPQAFLIYFLRGEDGVWRIDGM